MIHKPWKCPCHQCCKLPQNYFLHFHHDAIYTQNPRNFLDKAIYTQRSLKTVCQPMKNPRLTHFWKKLNSTCLSHQGFDLMWVRIYTNVLHLHAGFYKWRWHHWYLTIFRRHLFLNLGLKINWLYNYLMSFPFHSFMY